MAKSSAKRNSQSSNEEDLNIPFKSNECNFESQDCESYDQENISEDESEWYKEQDQWYQDQQSLLQQNQNQEIGLSKLQQVEDQFKSVSQRASNALSYSSNAVNNISDSAHSIGKVSNESQRCLNSINSIEISNKSLSSAVENDLLNNNIEFAIANIRYSFQNSRISQSKADEAYNNVEIAASLYKNAQKQLQTLSLMLNSVAEAESSVQSLNRFMIEESQKSAISDEEYAYVEQSNQICQEIENTRNSLSNTLQAAQEIVRSAALSVQYCQIIANECQARVNECVAKSNNLVQQYNQHISKQS